MRILVADDDEVSALVLSERLEDLGYHVSVARDGAEAWARMQQAEYRLLILDWMMPELDGMELCRRVRQTASDRYTYIILLTGRTDRKDRLEALEGGADDFLTKPLDEGELIARLKAADRILRSEDALRLSNHELQVARTKELQIGAHIQQRLLYTPPPTSISAIRTESLSIPSQAVDGDFCDFFDLGPSIVDVVVGDVMGKGVPAAMVGAGVKTNLQRSLLKLILSGEGGELPRPQQLISHLDRAVCGELIELNTFLTLCYSRFDAEKATLTYVNCGHPKIVHWRALTGDIDLLDPTAVPLGFSDSVDYEEETVSLGPGDLILFYSDGITDLKSADGGRLGMSGFADWLLPLACRPLDEIMSAMVKLRDESPGSASARDDFTAVAVRFVGNESPTPSGLRFWADTNSLRRIREYVMAIADTAGFSRRELGEVQLAVQEAASNAVRHARPGHSGIPLSVSATVTEGNLRVELSYPGVIFDATNVPEPILDGSKDGGFGVAIIRKCMDTVTYDTVEGLNWLVLEKRPADPAADVN